MSWSQHAKRGFLGKMNSELRREKCVYLDRAIICNSGILLILSINCGVETVNIMYPCDFF